MAIIGFLEENNAPTYEHYEVLEKSILTFLSKIIWLYVLIDLLNLDGDLYFLRYEKLCELHRWLLGVLFLRCSVLWMQLPDIPRSLVYLQRTIEKQG